MMVFFFLVLVDMVPLWDFPENEDINQNYYLNCTKRIKAVCSSFVMGQAALINVKLSNGN